MLQCGDPKGTGTGGPGYTIPDENLKDKRLQGRHLPGGHGRDGQHRQQAHTGGSQFFLVYKDSQLPPDYTPFGTISEAGMKVLKKIADGRCEADRRQGDDGTERDRRDQQGDASPKS